MISEQLSMQLQTSVLLTWIPNRSNQMFYSRSKLQSKAIKICINVKNNWSEYLRFYKQNWLYKGRLCDIFFQQHQAILTRKIHQYYKSRMEDKKGQWPELVGISGEEARNIILKDDSTIDVKIIPEGSPVTKDFRVNRVRVFVNGEGNVVHPPRRG